MNKQMKKRSKNIVWNKFITLEQNVETKFTVYT